MVTRFSRPASFVLACVLSAAGVIGVMATASPASAAPVSGTYHATSPTRFLDTRTGVGAVAGAVAATHDVVLQVAGIKTVPTGASAVVLNVTVTEPKRVGYVTVYADGVARPQTSNLNFVVNQTVPTLVVVSVPSNGRVHLFNGSGGTVQLIADVSGYFTGGTPPSGQGAFGAVTPRRLLDTRTGIDAAAVLAQKSVAFSVTGSGVPLGVSAVVVSVTVTEPQLAGFITAYGGVRPAASNLNFVAKQTVPNLVVVPVGSNGKVTLFNGSPGTVQLIADISGYFLAGDPVSAGVLGALSPVRLLDTRNGTGAPKIAVAPSKTVTVSVGGRGGVPLGGTGAVVLNVTATAPTGQGFLTVYDAEAGAGRTTVSNLNFTKGQTVPNLVVAQVSSTGTVTFFNGSNGTVQILADVSGYIPSASAPLPATSTSHYVRNITGQDTDAGKMQAEGDADAQAGSTFVLLDIGAQSNNNDVPSVNLTALSPASPGVRLTGPGGPVRLTYPQLRTAVDAYTLGFSLRALGGATVAVGTNSSGFSAGYTADKKGTDWAHEVIGQLLVRPNVTLTGANDIEASFGDTQANALAWETSYLAATTSALVYTGSADGCPTTFGSADNCGSVAGQSGPNWTRAGYASLTHGLAPSRITALPQIYYGSQAVQWANINATAGGVIVFAGVLTENASACGADCAMTPGQGWAALYHSISTTVMSPVIPFVTDLRVDS